MEIINKIFPEENEDKLTADIQVKLFVTINLNKRQFFGINIIIINIWFNFLQECLDAALNGVIYVKMGTHLPYQMQYELMETFRCMNQQFIWEHEKVDGVLPSNIIICKNSPSRLILSHKNTSLLITQDDTVSIKQALHYGIPMLIIPFQNNEVTIFHFFFQIKSLYFSEFLFF